MKPEHYYHNLRAPWTPDHVRLVLLFESPPVSGKYFYDPDGKTTEPLFSAVMKLFSWAPVDKAEGLALMKEHGYLLLDPTYQQVNGVPGRQRRRIMREEYPQLRTRLPDAPILIGKTTTLDAVGDLLVADGFEVLNKGARIPFPSNGRQRQFHDLARQVLDNE